MATYLGGFSPLKYKNGSPYIGAVTAYIASGAFFPGDFVKLDGTSKVPGAATNGLVRPSRVPLRGVVVATNGATESVLGVCVGFEPSPTALDTPVGATAPIASGQVVYVVDDVNVIFSGKLSGASTFNNADLGLNTVINTGTAGANGRSGMLVDAAVANAAAAPLKIVNYIDSADNNTAASSTTAAAGVQLQVIINNSQMAPATGQVGV